MGKIEKFYTEEYYHIYNRGVDKRTIFKNGRDYARFMRSLNEFNNSDPAWLSHAKITQGITRGLTSSEAPFVDIVAYCLMPNHYHLILKQISEKGITEYMRKIGTGYSMYFNKKNNRSGVLFQGKFKAVHIDSNDYLLYVSAYVNCNCMIHGYSNPKNYNWCSFQEYINQIKGFTRGKEVILGQFKNSEEYSQYALIQAREAKDNKKMKDLIIEE